MDLIQVLIYLVVSLVVKYLARIFYIQYKVKDFSKVRVKGVDIKLNNYITIKDHMDIITFSIITGMGCYITWFFINPYESAIAMIGYLISCSIDYKKLIKLYMIDGK